MSEIEYDQIQMENQIHHAKMEHIYLLLLYADFMFFRV